MEISTELVLFTTSILFFLSILASKAGNRFGVPALLLFLGVGMASGVDGAGIEFSNYSMANSISTVALCMILFSGGLDTKLKEIRPVIVPGSILASIGVFITALLLGGVIWWVLGKTLPSAGIGFITSLLLASTLSSTDSASVFSILRGKGLHLKNNLRPMLELESGSNDPMAYILTITLVQLLTSQDTPNWGYVGVSILVQIAIGAVVGYLLGKLAVIIINRIEIDNSSLYPILLVTISLFIFSAVYLLQGNAYLAVYVGGVVIGNAHFSHKRVSLNFFDGLAWLFQLIMFLTLGLLVNPNELIPLILPGLIISMALIFVVRPISVFLCLTPFKKIGVKDKLFVSWVGLRGAVPIVFAIIPLAADVPHATILFNMVFLCTLISLIVQGTTLAPVAKLLRLIDTPPVIRKPESFDFDFDFSDEIHSELTEIEVSEQLLAKGRFLKELELPSHTLVVLVKRADTYFVPAGNSELMPYDKLLIVTDNEQALSEVITPQMK